MIRYVNKLDDALISYTVPIQVPSRSMLAVVSVMGRALWWMYVGKHVELVETGQHVEQHVDK